MNLVELMNLGFSRLANIAETLRTRIGNLGSLTTTEKSNLVAAINEVKASQASASGIDDATTSTSSTWSSSKIGTAITQAITDLIGGADVDNDTLKELADKITGLVQADNGLVSATQAQSFTALQQAQALTNIGGVATADIGDTATDFVAVIAGIYGE